MVLLAVFSFLSQPGLEFVVEVLFATVPGRNYFIFEEKKKSNFRFLSKISLDRFPDQRTEL